MKKTCLGCRALRDSFTIGFDCTLDYKMDGMKGIPQEECPKPLTFTALFNAKRKGHILNKEEKIIPIVVTNIKDIFKQEDAHGLGTCAFCEKPITRVDGLCDCTGMMYER